MKSVQFWNFRSPELWVALLTMLVVLAISSVQLRLGEMKTRDTARRSDTELVGRALDAYFKDHDIYPASSNGQIVSCGNKALSACTWGDSSFIDEDGITYLKNMPTDPFAAQGWHYVYEVNEQRTKYRIYARLEYTSDPAVKSEQSLTCTSSLRCNWFVEN